MLFYNRFTLFVHICATEKPATQNAQAFPRDKSPPCLQLEPADLVLQFRRHLGQALAGVGNLLHRGGLLLSGGGDSLRLLRRLGARSRDRIDMADDVLASRRHALDGLADLLHLLRDLFDDLDDTAEGLAHRHDLLCTDLDLFAALLHAGYGVLRIL